MTLLMGDEPVQVENGRTTRDSIISDRLIGVRFAVSCDSVSYVEARKVSPARSIGAGAGGLLVVMSVVAIVAVE